MKAARGLGPCWQAGGGEVPVDVTPPKRKRARVFVLAHGAGGSRLDPLLVGLGERLAAAGQGVVRFDFRYRAEGRKLPDRAPVCEATYRDVVSEVRRRFDGPLWLGGKSMGGRMASHLAAAGDAMAGLVLLGYPLHPAKQPAKLRKDHLPSIRVPTLFVQGTRDNLADLALLRPIVAAMAAPVKLHVVDGGDHSLSVPKSSGRTRDQVLDEVASVVLAFTGG